MLVVGIGEYIVSDDKKESIVTYALGSCVGVVLHCPISKKTALAHVVLPQKISHYTSGLERERPAYFVEDVLPGLVEEFISGGCSPRNLQVHVLGGADNLKKDDIFKVGRRNVDKTLDILNSYGLNPVTLKVGGHFSRTVSVDIIDGKIKVKEHRMII